MTDQHGANYTIAACSPKVNGRIADIKTTAIMENKTASTVTSVGPGAPTLAERQKAKTILAVLQGESQVATSPFIQTIYPDGKDVVWPDSFATLDETPPITFTQRPLNSSQEQAVNAMLTRNNSTRLTLIHGPPGTGKTTVSLHFLCVI